MSELAWENRLPAAVAVRDYHVNWFQDVRRQVQSGQPFAICNGDEIEEVLTLLGIPVLIMNNWNNEVINQGRKPTFNQVLHDAGYPGDHMFAMGLATTIDPSHAPWGGLPRPTVLVSGGKFEMEFRVSELWARQLGCPLYTMDFMFSPLSQAPPDLWWERLRDEWDTIIDPHRVALRVEQEKAFIAYMERETGRTFSFDALVEASELINQQMDLWHEAQDLIASAPLCPVSVRDQMAIYQAMWHRGRPEAVEMIRTYRDEIAARVEAGVAAHPGEKIRLYFNGRVPPWHEEIAKDYGAVSVACSFSSIPDLYARNTKNGDPFPAMASRHVFLFAQGPARMLAVARHHRCDGVIVIEPKMGSGYPSIEQTTIEAAGIPYLALPRKSDDPEIVKMVRDFIEQRLV